MKFWKFWADFVDNKYEIIYGEKSIKRYTRKENGNERQSL